MNVKQIIPAGSINLLPEGTPFNKVLEVSEFFYDTIQGEGIYTGVPAVFLRLQHCTLNCDFCDTTEVWNQGSPYSQDQLLDLIEKHDVHTRLLNGHHLVLTGGSPLKQQIALTSFILAFRVRFEFKPFIEVENEAVLPIMKEFAAMVDCWNNSPKLASSGNSYKSRFKPEILKQLSSFKDSWFKFVICNVDDWVEIESDFLGSILPKHQIILMPQGQTREELMRNSELVVELAVKYGVRYCTREHVILWDKLTGV